MAQLNNVVEQFLENVKSPDWKKEVSRIVDSFRFEVFNEFKVTFYGFSRRILP